MHDVGNDYCTNIESDECSCSLQCGKKYIQVSINSWSEVNTLLATEVSASRIAPTPSKQLCVRLVTSPLLVPHEYRSVSPSFLTPNRSYSAMLLFEGAESVLKSLPPTTNPAMHRLLQAISPMKRQVLQPAAASLEVCL